MNLELWEKGKNGNLDLGAIRGDGGCGRTRRAVHGVKNTKGTQAKQAFQEKRDYQLCKLPLRQKQRI